MALEPEITESIIEWNDIQGIVRRGYGKHRCSLLAILKVTNKKLAGNWLANLVNNSIASGSDVSNMKNLIDDTLVTVAFTEEGLRAMGLVDEELNQFSQEFTDGMAPKPIDKQETTRRSGMLGDIGRNSPANWYWGGFEEKNKDISQVNNPVSKKPLPPHAVQKRALAKDVHILLNIYATSHAEVEAEYRNLTKAGNGITLCVKKSATNKYETKFSTYLRDDNCEQFGYRDGISNPVIKGTRIEKKLTPDERELHCIAPGEILLGYSKGRDQLIPVPVIDNQSGVGSKSKKFEFGKNGSYLAVRQLEQHVEKFHAMLRKNAKKLREYESTQEGADWLAARIMGRQFSGDPIEKEQSNFSMPPVPNKLFSPVQPIPKKLVGPFQPQDKKRYDNQFRYTRDDRDGMTCPLTSHIRRSFPRDVLGSDPRVAIRIANRHRLLRRGRLYGNNPLPESKQAHSFVDKNSDNICGLMFMAFNSDISGQFETVQHSWINNRHFGGKYKEAGPVAGQGDEDTGIHTIQQRPVNIRLDEIEDFITVRGGAYFFMPGLKALSQLALIAQNRN